MKHALLRNSSKRGGEEDNIESPGWKWQRFPDGLRKRHIQRRGRLGASGFMEAWCIRIDPDDPAG